MTIADLSQFLSYILWISIIFFHVNKFSIYFGSIVKKNRIIRKI